MQDTTSREQILKRIRKALIHKTDPRFPSIDWERNVFSSGGSESLEEQFAVAFTKIGGQFVFCENELEFLDNVVRLSQEKSWKHFYCYEERITSLLESVEFPFSKTVDGFPEEMVGITTCEALIARLGSILVSSRQGSGRNLFVVPTVHIVLAYTSQLVGELKDGFALIKTKYPDLFPSMIGSIAGPSRTADIEKTLVSPAHGPRDLFVFLVDDTLRS